MLETLSSRAENPFGLAGEHTNFERKSPPLAMCPDQREQWPPSSGAHNVVPSLSDTLKSEIFEAASLHEVCRFEQHPSSPVGQFI
jgi:hypothetical protein